MNADRAHKVDLTGANFASEVLESKQPVLVAFLTPWSHACRFIEPVIDEVARACVGRLKVLIVNADEQPELGLWYGIQKVPTLLCFVSGKEWARIVGTVSREAILSRLEALLSGV